jgi:hypothetical protein
MQGVILVKNQGQVLPQPLIEKVFAQKPSVMGYQTVSGENIVIDRVDKDLPTVEEFMANQEANKEPCVLFWFGISTNPIPEDSIQPFDLVNDTGGHLVTVMLDGEYESQGKPESSQSDEYHLYAEYLGPTIEKALKLNNGDVDKLIEEIRSDPMFKKNLDQCSINRGCAVFFTADGEIIKLEKNNDRAWSGPEGWASNHCGFVEKSSQDVQKVDDKKPAVSMASFRSKKSGTTPPVIASTDPIPQPNGTTIAALNDKTDTAVDKVARPMITPAKGINGKNQRRQAYEKHCLHVPEGYKDKDIPAPANDEWMAANAGKYQPFGEGLKQVQDKIKKGEAEPPVMPDPPLVVPPKRKEAINNLLKSDKVKAMIDQSKVLNTEDLKNPKVANYIQQMGWDILDLYRWDRRILKLVMEQMDNDERINFTLALIWEHMSLFQSSGGTTAEIVNTAPPAEEKKEEPKTTPKIVMNFRRKTG